MNGRFYDWVLTPFEKAKLRVLRRELLGQAQGKILEIGAGTGLNLPWYPKLAELTALEPDEGMLKVLRQRHFSGARFEWVAGNAEMLPFADHSFDTVVATLVFCSIEHPEMAMREVLRVLKPGGRLLLLEHVRRNTPVAGAVLDVMTPLWKRVAGGCHLNRRTTSYLPFEKFEVQAHRTLWSGLGEFWVLKLRGAAPQPN